MRGDKKTDIKKAEALLHNKYEDNRYNKLRMANVEQVKSFLGYEIGGVPPTAFYEKCEVICDSSILESDFVVGAAEDQHKGLRINPKDLKKIYTQWETIGI